MAFKLYLLKDDILRYMQGFKKEYSQYKINKNLACIYYYKNSKQNNDFCLIINPSSDSNYLNNVINYYGSLTINFKTKKEMINSLNNFNTVYNYDKPLKLKHIITHYTYKEFSLSKVSVSNEKDKWIAFISENAFKEFNKKLNNKFKDYNQYIHLVNKIPLANSRKEAIISHNLYIKNLNV